MASLRLAAACTVSSAAEMLAAMKTLPRRASIPGFMSGLVAALIAAAQGDVGRFDEDKDFVPGFELHLTDRPRRDDRGDFADARVDDDLT